MVDRSQPSEPQMRIANVFAIAWYFPTAKRHPSPAWLTMRLRGTYPGMHRRRMMSYQETSWISRLCNAFHCIDLEGIYYTERARLTHQILLERYGLP